MNGVSPTQNWIVRKPLVRTKRGLVVSQNATAAEVGARILGEGGNAVDAAVAAGFALAALEPWNSGLGGIGYMVAWQQGSRAPKVVEFGPVSPRRLDPGAFPLTEGTGGDLFGWPRVASDRNVHGPLSFTVPGQVDGLGLAHEKFGRLPWAAVLAPAIEQAERGLPVDWFTTLRVSLSAPDLARHRPTAQVWLPSGFPPASPPRGESIRLRIPRLADTLRRIAVAGRRDFYEGALARRIVGDIADLGGVLDADDLAAYEARLADPLAFAYRGISFYSAGGLTAGPTLAATMALLKSRRFDTKAPGPEAFLTYAEALTQAYRERLDRMGDVQEPVEPACTTHLNVVDAEGNVAALTQTLLSVFGSKVLLPETGILMNNGIMWFDPRPGRQNSIAPGKRPLSNMCPVIAARKDLPWIAIGASGGRKIVSAVTQIVSFLTDFGMDLETALHHPRIDASGEPEIRIDPRLGDSIAAALSERFATRIAEHVVLPANYACPCAILIDPETGERSGMTDVMSPWSGARAEVRPS